MDMSTTKGKTTMVAVIADVCDGKKRAIGYKEYVYVEEMPELGCLVAKIDTGAYSNSLHVDEIHEVVDAQGRKVVQYRATADSPVRTTDQYIRKIVTSSNGVSEERYVIEMHIRLGDKSYVGRVGLTDRGTMRNPMLIGRRFLRYYGFVVDVGKRFSL